MTYKVFMVGFRSSLGVHFVANFILNKKKKNAIFRNCRDQKVQAFKEDPYSQTDNISPRVNKKQDSQPSLNQLTWCH